MIFSTHRGVADAKQASGVRRKYPQTSAWQGKSFVYFQDISIRCQPIDSGSNNFPSPVCAAAFASRNHAGGAHFEMKKLDLTEDELNQRKRQQAREATKRWRERNPQASKERSRKHALEYYYKNRAKCAEKAAKFRAANKDKMAIYNAEYRAANKAKLDAYMKEWHRKNKDALASRRKANYEANRDAFLTEKREYYIKNRDTIRAKKKTNREPSRRNEDIRRARKAGATVGDLRLIAEWEKRWRRKPLVRCYWCRSDIKPAVATRDHIVPLARDGEHSVANLVVSCGSCNSKKHARPLDKWNATLEQPVLL